MASAPITLDLLAIGERLRGLRGSRTQAEWGEQLGSSRMSVVRYEAGARTPDAEFLANLQAATGASVMWVLTGDGAPPKPAAPALTAEEEVLLDYFRSASKEIRRAALAMLAGAQPMPPRGPSTAVHIAGDVTGGQHNHTHAAGSVGVQYGKTVIKGRKRSE